MGIKVLTLSDQTGTLRDVNRSSQGPIKDKKGKGRAYIFKASDTPTYYLPEEDENKETSDEANN